MGPVANQKRMTCLKGMKASRLLDVVKEWDHGPWDATVTAFKGSAGKQVSMWWFSIFTACSSSIPKAIYMVKLTHRSRVFYLYFRWKPKFGKSSHFKVFAPIFLHNYPNKLVIPDSVSSITVYILSFIPIFICLSAVFIWKSTSISVCLELNLSAQPPIHSRHY